MLNEAFRFKSCASTPALAGPEIFPFQIYLTTFALGFAKVFNDEPFVDVVLFVTKMEHNIPLYPSRIFMMNWIRVRNRLY